MWPALQTLPIEEAPFLLRYCGDPRVELSIETEKPETTVQMVYLQNSEWNAGSYP